MTWADFHTHCRFCDGAAEPAVMLQTAIDKNLRAYGFSSHAPVPFDTTWTMKPGRLPEYVRTIQELKESAPIPVYLGLEIDFIPGVTGPDSPAFKNLPLDYRLASVHFLGEDASIGRFWWTVDDSDEVFARGLHEIFNDDIRDLVERYYARIRELVRNESFDVLGHLDLIKKNNGDGKYFSEDAPWYRDAVEETLEAIAASGRMMEVNTGGISRNKIKALYPSDWVLQRAAELKIPIALNSDCHAPTQIAALFSESAAKLLEFGFPKLHVLHQGAWQAMDYSPDGLVWK